MVGKLPRRPLSAHQIPPKYSINATVDEALEGALPLVCNKDGSMDLNKYNNYMISIEDFESKSEYVDTFLDKMDLFQDCIYSITIRGVYIEETLLNRIICGVSTFGFLKYLIELDLSFNNLSYESQDTLFDTLDISKSGYCPIKRLILTRCNLGPRGVKACLNRIKSNTYLEEVLLNSNNCGDETIPGLLDVLLHPDCNIVELGFGGNRISFEGMKIFCERFSQNKSLKRLQWHHNHIGDKGAELLFAIIRDNNRLESLNLSNCGIQNCHWATSLHVISSLSALYLSNNEIDDEGLRNICVSLEYCFSLRHLDLSHCDFHGELCISLGQALRVNKGLLYFSLSSNRILLEEVWIAIMHGLMENKTLLTLDLTSCEIDLKTASLLSEAFVENETCTINLDYNALPTELIRDCRKYFQSKTPSIKVLSPDAPGISIREGMKWRKDKLCDITEAREAMKVLQELNIDGLHESDGQPMTNVTKIFPHSAVLKKNKDILEVMNQNIELYNDSKKEISIYYGSELEFLGCVEVNNATTYYQLQVQVRPLVRDYFASSNPDGVKDLVENFQLLDMNMKLVPKEVIQVRTVWPEACLNDKKIFIRPANWITLPPEDSNDLFSDS